jgi:hypothetical protein
MPRAASALLLGVLLAQGAAQAAEPPPLQLGEDGQAVLDASAGLLWSRCVEGMQWDGRRCAGQPQRLTHAQAIAAAARRAKAEGLPWRLPRLQELRRLGDRSAKVPGLDPRFFPGAPDDWYWTATANLHAERNRNPYNYGNVMRGDAGGRGSGEAALFGWAVMLSSGEGRGDMPKATALPVRLVRSVEKAAP